MNDFRKSGFITQENADVLTHVLAAVAAEHPGERGLPVPAGRQVGAGRDLRVQINHCKT